MACRGSVEGDVTQAMEDRQTVPANGAMPDQSHFLRKSLSFSFSFSFLHSCLASVSSVSSVSSVLNSVPIDQHGARERGFIGRN
jgi:hypothetical protein